MWLYIPGDVNDYKHIYKCICLYRNCTFNDFAQYQWMIDFMEKLLHPCQAVSATRCAWGCGTALPSVSSQGKEACCCQWLRVTNPLKFLFTTFGTPSKLTIAKSIFLCIDHFGEHFSGTLTFHFPKDMSRSCLMQGSGTDWIKGNLHGLTPFKGTKLSTNSSCLLFCFCENKDAEP